MQDRRILWFGKEDEWRKKKKKKQQVKKKKGHLKNTMNAKTLGAYQWGTSGGEEEDKKGTKIRKKKRGP